MQEQEQETEKETIRTTAEHLAEHVTECVETYLKLGAINAVQKATDVAAAALATFVLTICVLFVLLFASFGAAIWLNEILDNPMAGYFCMGGFYVLCAALFFAVREKWIVPFLRDHLVGKGNE